MDEVCVEKLKYLEECRLEQTVGPSPDVLPLLAGKLLRPFRIIRRREGSAILPNPPHKLKRIGGQLLQSSKHIVPDTIKQSAFSSLTAGSSAR